MSTTHNYKMAGVGVGIMVVGIMAVDIIENIDITMKVDR
jgi:hypothetical protein